MHTPHMTVTQLATSLRASSNEHSSHPQERVKARPLISTERRSSARRFDMPRCASHDAALKSVHTALRALAVGSRLDDRCRMAKHAPRDRRTGLSALSTGASSLFMPLAGLGIREEAPVLSFCGKGFHGFSSVEACPDGVWRFVQWLLHGKWIDRSTTPLDTLVVGPLD